MILRSNNYNVRKDSNENIKKNNDDDDNSE